ncbi:hypothetical protein [Candidatus Mycoplasma haematobovis]|nr:hypothetical protein [Candidatus Mycoplasma haematobovis]
MLFAGITSGAGISYHYLSNQPQPKKEKKERKKAIGISTIKVVSIAQKLEEVGYLVLKTEGTEDDEQWDILLKAYNKNKEQDQKFTNSTSKKETRNRLKNHCKKAIISNSEKNNNYSIAKRWCVKPESINDMLTRNNYTKLIPKNTEKSKWRKRFDLIKDNAEEKKKMGLEFNDNKNNNIALLQEACKKLKISFSKTYASKDFEEHYTQAKNWCSESNT